MNRLMLCLLAFAAAARNQAGADRTLAETTQPALMWRAPHDVGMENWTCAPAGCADRPVPPFHFLKEDMEGTFPKLTVKDAKGRTWSVKFGGKVIPECFSSRFVAALGYAVESSYYVGDGKLVDTVQLTRARRLLQPDGSFQRARFQLRDANTMDFLKDHAWSLADNPFRGSHEFAGLRVAMMLLSNWDGKDVRNGEEESNTGVFRVPGPNGAAELFYSFFDWGSTLGRWGKVLRRTRSDCSGFVGDSPHMITGVKGNIVQWGYSGKHEDDVKEGITVDDLRWLAPYLSAISNQQIRAGLKASGATDRQATCWAGGLEYRMREIQAVARTGRYWQ